MFFDDLLQRFFRRALFCDVFSQSIILGADILILASELNLLGFVCFDLGLVGLLPRIVAGNAMTVLQYGEAVTYSESEQENA